MLTLYGGDRSPFVRRVAYWLNLQGRPYIRRPVDLWVRDFVSIREKNPLSRVPILELEDGSCLIESFSIIDHLEDSAEPAQRLLPATGLARRAVLHDLALASAVAEKGVALVYETERRPADTIWPDWQARLTAQVQSGLAALEPLVPSEGWHGGPSPDGADAALVALYVFLGTVKAEPLLSAAPRLAAYGARAEREPAFVLPPLVTSGA